MDNMHEVLLPAVQGFVAVNDAVKKQQEAREMIYGLFGTWNQRWEAHWQVLTERARRPSLSQGGNTLPPEVYFAIFRLLAVNDLVNAGLVCKEWYSVATDDLLWKAGTFLPNPSPLAGLTLLQTLYLGRLQKIQQETLRPSVYTYWMPYHSLGDLFALCQKVDARPYAWKDIFGYDRLAWTGLAAMRSHLKKYSPISTIAVALMIVLLKRIPQMAAEEAGGPTPLTTKKIRRYCQEEQIPSPRGLYSPPPFLRQFPISWRMYKIADDDLELPSSTVYLPDGELVLPAAPIQNPQLMVERRRNEWGRVVEHRNGRWHDRKARSKKWMNNKMPREGSIPHNFYRRTHR